MGISNGRRKIKSVVAVLQMINLYQRQLKLAQLNHPRIVPWSKAISPSSDIELADKTLLIKGRSTDNGLLERLNMCSGINLIIPEELCLSLVATKSWNSEKIRQFFQSKTSEHRKFSDESGKREVLSFLLLHFRVVTFYITYHTSS